MSENYKKEITETSASIMGGLIGKAIDTVTGNTGIAESIGTSAIDILKCGKILIEKRKEKNNEQKNEK